jgi:hypothetical protein
MRDKKTETFCEANGHNYQPVQGEKYADVEDHAAIHAILCQVRRAESAEQELQKARVLMTRLVTLSILGASRWPRVVIDLAATYRAFLATEGKEGKK